jgi:hypothetical protein
MYLSDKVMELIGYGALPLGAGYLVLVRRKRKPYKAAIVATMCAQVLLIAALVVYSYQVPSLTPPVYLLLPIGLSGYAFQICWIIWSVSSPEKAPVRGVAGAQEPDKAPAVTSDEPR